jgi:hypothetical protein
MTRILPRSITESHGLEPKVVKNINFIKTPCHSVTSVVLLFFMVLSQGFAQEVPRGDRAMAERYAQWAKDTMEMGLWSEAHSGLERAADFADVSSDIGYLLALTRLHENKPRADVLEALNLALLVDHWVIYNAELARFEKADTLIALRLYPEALQELSLVRRGPRRAALTLKALSNYRLPDFSQNMREALDLYPRESEPVRIFLNFLSNEEAAGRNPEREELDLLEIVIRRLPILIQDDPELAWMASPFIRDVAEARRMVMAYRAVNKPSSQSIPIALKLGVINEETALNELFSPQANLDIALLDKTWELFRSEETLDMFKTKLASYTGTITEDSDRDGIPETTAMYIRGTLEYSLNDVNQDGIHDLIIYYEAGIPRRGVALLPPENSGRKQAEILWERYPSILEVRLDRAKYIPRPLDHFYNPVRFVDLFSSGTLFPRWDPMNPPLTRKVLVSKSLRVERSSLEFRGGTEVVELEQGIPIRAREYVGGLMVSETDFLRGRPQHQKVDLDFDGKMETVRFFKKQYRQVELEELWDFDRFYDRVVTVYDWEEL